MNIKATNKYDDKSYECDIEDLVETLVDGSDYERGELETLRATVRNQTKLLAKIVEKLNLSNEELNDWLAPYDVVLTKLE